MPEDLYEGNRYRGTRGDEAGKDRKYKDIADKERQEKESRKKLGELTEEANKGVDKVGPMPKQADYPDLTAFGAAMRKWREQARTAKDAAGALAGRPAPSPSPTPAK